MLDIHSRLVLTNIDINTTNLSASTAPGSDFQCERAALPRIHKTAHTRRPLLWSLAFLAILAGALLRCGGDLLVTNDPINSCVDAAVVLQGSVIGEQARVAGAVRLLQQAKTKLVVLSVPKESYWGQPVAPIAHDYIEKLYGPTVAEHIEFCEINAVDSTKEESEALAQCIDDRGWKSVAIVTSNYHSRRAGMIWRTTLRRLDSHVLLYIQAVPDPEFHPAAWWYDRRSAKTWLLEFTKLIWSMAGRS